MRLSIARLIAVSIPLLLCAFGPGFAQQPGKIKIILDTDIGDDIDDAWALAFLISHQNFQPLGVTVTHGNTPARM
ncbi:MAG TPA: nucleoside hydrolase, partial [Blastocatellia bacterium]